MNISKFLVTMSAVLYCFSGSLSFAGSLAGPIIIDHNTNDLSQIPDYWIDQVKQKIKAWFWTAIAFIVQLVYVAYVFMLEFFKRATSFP